MFTGAHITLFVCSAKNLPHDWRIFASLDLWPILRKEGYKGKPNSEFFFWYPICYNFCSWDGKGRAVPFTKYRLGKCANNQNGNLRWHLLWRGGVSRGSRLPLSYFEKWFLSDPSPIIGYACHSLPNWLTHWLTDSLLFSGLGGCEWYQLLDDAPTATESCEKLS